VTSRLTAGNWLRGNTSGKLDVRPFPNAGPIDGQLNAYSANYNALGVKLDRRLSEGVQVLVAYTYQKALNGDNSNMQNLYRPSLTYGVASFNRKHDINITRSTVASIPADRNHVVIGGGVSYALHGVGHVGTYKEDTSWSCSHLLTVIIKFQKATPHQHQF
jgi:hypothetical protein